MFKAMKAAQNKAAFIAYMGSCQVNYNTYKPRNYLFTLIHHYYFSRVHFGA